jgi:hypothetical protein
MARAVSVRATAERVRAQREAAATRETAERVRAQREAAASVRVLSVATREG